MEKCKKSNNFKSILYYTKKILEIISHTQDYMIGLKLKLNAQFEIKNPMSHLVVHICALAPKSQTLDIFSETIWPIGTKVGMMVECDKVLSKILLSV